MTGPINASAGLVTAPGYTFSGASKTGFYLAGANQIGWAANGIQGATFNADTSITFAGTISANKGTIPIGFVGGFAGSTAPAGWLLCFGQQVSTTTYAALFAVLGTTYGSGAGTFGIPDYRGRSDYGQDNMGGSAANRITVAGGNFDGTVLGGTGGGQNQTLTLNQLPGGINSSASNTITVTTSGSGTPNLAGTNGTIGTDGVNSGTNFGIPGVTLGSATWGAVTSLSGANTINVSSNNTGGLSHPIMNPAIITNKIIFAGV
jgi:microcystin-dependent protein